MSVSEERTINIEAVRISSLRELGPLADLGQSLVRDGQRHPITVWSDGTVISGHRRVRAQFLLAGAAGGARWRQIQAVFVDTLEDAAKRLQMDGGYDDEARPWTPSEKCNLIALLRHLDTPAARQRAEVARRRGVELRRRTFAGERPPGRASGHSKDYVLGVLAPALGMSETTAKRLWTIFSLATGQMKATDEKMAQARAALAAIDAGRSSISANYAALTGGRTAPAPLVTRQYAPKTPAAPADRQILAWERALPQLEGLTSGLAELGPPNPALTWEQVGPVHTRLAAVRRELEKMIRDMKEINK